MYLLISAIVVSSLAWAFWHYFGNEASTILSTIILLALAVENFRLRRKLQEIAATQSPKT